MMKRLTDRQRANRFFYRHMYAVSSMKSIDALTRLIRRVRRAERAKMKGKG